jgi:flagellar biosynthesis protein FlhF
MTAPAAPGTCFKFTVASAEEAATLIRERLGPDARVLSVRSVEAAGLKKLWAAPRLEVVAQVGEPEPAAGPEPEPPAPTQPAAAAAAAEPKVARLRRPAPTGNDLPTLLRRSGLSEVALGRLQQAPFWSGLAALPLHRAFMEIGREVQAEAEARWARAPLTRAAFIGTPGVGRTTALCKWLGREVFRRARVGHVVTAEFETPHSPGVLPVFCEALGVPVARHPASTEPASPGGFVYLDLPGLSLRDLGANRPMRALLDEEGIRERVLVLNAAYDHAALRAAYAAGRELGATHLVFTHLDEVPQWGRLWDYLLDGALEPLFLATGPSLTGDCEDDVFETLVRRTLIGAAPEPVEEPRHQRASP